MLAVGLLVSKVSKKAICLMSLVFVTLMLTGGVLTLIPVEIVYAENVMHLSALLLGLTIISGYKVSSLIAMPLVANFALFHGYVHAYDIWLDADAFGYTVGFALATTTLILLGIGTRSLIDRVVPEDDTRVFGGSFHR
jgi:urease accessory protein